MKRRCFPVTIGTIDRIVMDVYSSAGSATGLPTGATAPTANKLDTLDFVYSGSISELGKNGASYFDGIIANVKMYNSGTLVRHYKINETWSNDLVLNDVSGNAQHGTAVNITSADAELYTFNAQDNAWLGGELVTNGGFDADTDWTKDAGWTISGGLANLAGNGTPEALRQNGVMTVGLKYSYGFNPVADSSAIGFQDSSGVLVDSGSDGARVSGSFTTDTTYLLFKRASGIVTGKQG